MGKPDLEFTVVCGCGRKIKMKARNMHRGKKVRCTCGQEFVVSNSGFTQAQRSLDRFADQLRRL